MNGYLALLGGVLLVGFAYFIYTQFNKKKNNSSGTAGGSSTGGTKRK